MRIRMYSITTYTISLHKSSSSKEPDRKQQIRQQAPHTSAVMAGEVHSEAGSRDVSRLICLMEAAEAQSESAARARSLAIRDEVLGPDHQGTAASLNAVSYVMRAQGKFAEAASLCALSLAIREEVLGPKHQATAASLDNLANILRAQGKLAEAGPVCAHARSPSGSRTR
eukprot:TRINITY_DN2310_c0_g1_i8.p1 TRINITY_DN2310_c0_g1~~TRINITY_DN2310_c0_g1_i8.p1  ORF type:complete len:170 (-),score=29.13 TRINITY_DN2310_c0_g1_i8:366-875(-)